MSKNWTYKSGDWWAICDSCGQKHKASEMKKRWDGFFVCSDDWEERHPQDFVKARQDKISVPWTRPRPTDLFIPQNWTPPVTEDVIVHDDNITYIAEWYRDITDTVIDTDDFVLEINTNIADTVSISESFVLLQITHYDLNESVTITEVLGDTVSPQYTDTVTTSETITPFLYNAQSATDTVNITETIVTSLTYSKAINGSPINRGI